MSPLEPIREKGKIWSHVRKKWLEETPEEGVRQEYLCTLVNNYHYSLEQIDEEVAAPGNRGTRNARADFVIWRTTDDRRTGKTALIVIECKADNVTIDQRAYTQGSNYAQYERSKFFVTHNRRSTKFWKVDLDKRAPNYSEIKDIPDALASDREIEELLSKLKPFEGKEFADLLHACHNIIRNNEHLDPAAAFDEIAKILFIKVWVERRLREKKERENIFTVDFLKRQMSRNPIQSLFDETKETYRADQIFDADERVNLRSATVEAIVRKLESYNLSDTSEDVKGIAFERFLGATFRGEIGQFFTPRPIVEFMIRMIAPKEGDTICDPASGSGGFLIRFFEIVREAIAADVDAKYKTFSSKIDEEHFSDAKAAKLKREKYDELQAELDPATDPELPLAQRQKSRIWKLANRCIYGTDANDRMARTSKMNMIMHGDGHGGVHHHNGLINTNGIFEGRFKIILTNPPFGANVTSENTIIPSDYRIPADVRSYYRREYGDAYENAVARVEAADGKPILSLFKFPRTDKTKTELLFVERCLDLLEPGGRLGIVLPEGVFNNPNDLSVRLREFVEDRARLEAVVSLPAETFKSTGADVKASLLFLTKFSIDDQMKYDRIRDAANLEVETKHVIEIKTQTELFSSQINAAKTAKDGSLLAELRKAFVQFQRRMKDQIAEESRALLKERFSYPIFMYEAQKVGISATGEADENELYPNDRLPSGCKRTCLELFNDFKKDPEPFFVVAKTK